MFTPWVPDMSLCTCFLYFALSDAILNLEHSTELGACKAEDCLGTVTKMCVGRDPALTLVSDYKVATFYPGTGEEPEF